mmetsp:Transcript_18088/g.26857  ORF Transcript_18088/g.26857 Transcript_18088/m.26857 type:complete len:154 (+) Transcript_18088:504-965(+)
MRISIMKEETRYSFSVSRLTKTSSRVSTRKRSILPLPYLPYGVHTNHSPPFVNTGCVTSSTATAGEPDNTNVLAQASVIVHENSQTCSLDHGMDICSFRRNLPVSWTADFIDAAVIGLPLDSTHRYLITPPTMCNIASEPPALKQQPIRITRA